MTNREVLDSLDNKSFTFFVRHCLIPYSTMFEDRETAVIKWLSAEASSEMWSQWNDFYNSYKEVQECNLQEHTIQNSTSATQ